MSHPVNEATATAGGETASATASRAIVVHGSGAAAPSSSTFFKVSATARSTAAQRPATASATASAPVSSPGATQANPEPQAQASVEPQAPALNTEPTPPQTALKPTAAKKSKPTKPSTKRPIPKILRMPAPSGRCWQDAAGNFHGLKRGRSSPASVAKYKKNEEPAASDLSCRTTSQPQGLLRRSPRNLNKNPNVRALDFNFIYDCHNCLQSWDFNYDSVILVSWKFHGGESVLLMCDQEKG
ncbi:hypothetical protein COLO4_12208 [Corchorus olitorius]|uniref:Uncharacterized protein n=1 Tax=Corchorus olitorius TaxID=93759 RepID=A0A1R3K1Q6_9ROSI|nr:hypothetical protein COLO4_12208 [Corchorus olitorius]